MKAALFFILLLASCLGCLAQSKTDKLMHIQAEGRRLYRSEMASWYGTDIFLAQFRDREKIGGYFSYPTRDGATCVFFSKAAAPVVIGTIAFDSTYQTGSAQTSLAERSFTAEELTLYTIRTNALAAISQDELFKTYKDTNLNIIPMVSGGEKKVYVLTATSKEGIVIFGNDYLLTFDAGNKVASARRLHKNIIPINYGKTDEGEVIRETMHTHLPETGSFLTATDVCTLMLYGRIAQWDRHTVVSKDYFTFWDCKSNQSATITKKALDRINKADKKRQAER